LIDPNEVMLRGRPKTVEDIYVSAKNNHLLSFENLSSISNEMSDALCTVSTGGGTAGRTLYTNAEETILKAHNPIILNGIGAVVLRQDLLDRTLGICLPVIEKRRTEQELQEAISCQLPKIFGGILTLFADTLAILPSVEIPAEELPRMADFAMLGEAMYRALGNTPGKWLGEADKQKDPMIKAKLMNTSTRLMEAFSRGALTLQKLQAGANQIVTVQHVSVNGQAVIGMGRR